MLVPNKKSAKPKIATKIFGTIKLKFYDTQYVAPR